MAVVRIKKRICLYLATCFAVSVLFSCGKKDTSITPGNKISRLPNQTASSSSAEVNKAKEGQIKAVVYDIDIKNKKLKAMDINSHAQFEIRYSSATDIKSKYDKSITEKRLQLGGIYDISNDSNGLATKIYAAKDAFEISSLSDLSFDQDNRKVNIGASAYNYDSKAVFLSSDDSETAKIIDLDQIVAQDEVTICGVDKTIYSVTVNKGHGFLRITGTQAFSGGLVSIGSEQVIGLSEGMLITVKEGVTNVELANADNTASKVTTIVRDKEVSLDFGEYTSPAVQQGAISFKITPAEAVMTIDGEEVDYSNPIPLTYGTHRLTLQANHYNTYSASFKVNSNYRTIVIDMESGSSSASSSTTASSDTSSSATDGYTVSVTQPEGAALYVDSSYIGVVPCTFVKKAGNRTITLRQSGYETISYSIYIQNNAGNLTYDFPAMTKLSTNSSDTQSTTKATIANN